MKTVKSILAIAVAVLLVAMMIPTAFAGTANDPNTINWTCSKPGYTYTVYKVADYNETTGAYTLAENASGVTQANIDAAVTEAQMATLANTCKTATLPTEGTAFTTNEGEGSFKLANGIYYIKCTQLSGNSKGVLTESIVVFPNANGTTEETIDFSGKVDEGQPKCYKDFLINGQAVHSEQSYGTNDTITYILKADVTGTAANKLTSYVITDKMGDGLNKSVHNVTAVYVLKADGTKVGGANLTAGTDYTVTTTSADINRVKADTVDGENETTGNTFGVKLNKDTILANDDFYAEGNQVVVEFETELAADAALNTDIPNDDDMIYGNDSGFNVVPGQQVVFKTYGIRALKKDAKTDRALIGDGLSAKFGLYSDADCEDELATAWTDTETGFAAFDIKLAVGTYYVKELEAPTGYNLNSEVQTVEITGDDAVATATISDTPAKLPSTGGNGTLMFTIIGGSLVLLAAGLFIVVMKKRSSAK